MSLLLSTLCLSLKVMASHQSAEVLLSVPRCCENRHIPALLTFSWILGSEIRAFLLAHEFHLLTHLPRPSALVFKVLLVSGYFRCFILIRCALPSFWLQRREDLQVSADEKGLSRLCRALCQDSHVVCRRDGAMGAEERLRRQLPQIRMALVRPACLPRFHFPLTTHHRHGDENDLERNIQLQHVGLSVVQSQEWCIVGRLSGAGGQRGVGMTFLLFP